MKTFFLCAICFTFMVFTCFSQVQKDQKDKTALFKGYISKFSPKDFPFKAIWDYDNRTPFTVPLPSISKNLYKLFICDNGIKCKSDYCDIKKFFGFLALGRFSQKENYIMVIATNDTDAGCDEKWYLISYAPDGKFLDKLWIFGKTYLKLSNEMDKDRTYLQIESTILENEINLEAKRYDYKGENKTVNNFKYKYSITSSGKFVKTEGPKETFQ